MRIVAAMSGGVDSSVAAARMVHAGHEVVGVHLALGGATDPDPDAAPNRHAVTPRTKGCCSIEDNADARRVADRLGIPFYVWDLADQFREDVIENFLSEYSAGHTPNPCLRCNERIKFAALLDKALALGFDGVATGHYARIVEPAGPGGTRELHRAVDPAKDQSYVLGVLDSEQLAASHFPLGGSVKPQVREEAHQLGLPVAEKPDSHDICFISSGDTRAWLTERLGRHPGPIVDTDGSVVGEHQGAYAYTVGQRRGLHLRRPASDGRPRYVVKTDPVSNTVVVGTEELLGIDVIVGERPRWCGSAPDGPIRVGAQLRAHGAELPAVADWAQDGGHDRVVVTLDRRTRGVAVGQAVVLYEGTRVVGSATITVTRRSAPTDRTAG